MVTCCNPTCGHKWPHVKPGSHRASLFHTALDVSVHDQTPLYFCPGGKCWSKFLQFQERVQMILHDKPLPKNQPITQIESSCVDMMKRVPTFSPLNYVQFYFGLMTKKAMLQFKGLSNDDNEQEYDFDYGFYQFDA